MFYLFYLFFWFLLSFEYLEDELVGLAQFGGVLMEVLVLLDLLLVGGVEQQLLDVRRLQPVGAQGHQDLPQLGRGELQVGDEDGCREDEEDEDEEDEDFSSIFELNKEERRVPALLTNFYGSLFILLNISVAPADVTLTLFIEAVTVNKTGVTNLI